MPRALLKNNPQSITLSNGPLAALVAENSVSINSVNIPCALGYQVLRMKYQRQEVAITVKLRAVPLVYLCNLLVEPYK